MTVVACLKPVARRVEVDQLDGTVVRDPRSWGWSAADEAALEVALRIAEARQTDVTAVSAGPPIGESPLRQAIALGATRSVLVETTDGCPSADVAAALAAVIDGSLVVCGDQSLDRGSGAVPAFVAARLGFDQALGCTSVELDGTDVMVTRRTDRGGRDLLRVTDSAVVSVEGSVARLRRASLPAVLDTGSTTVRRADDPGASAPTATIVSTRPFRPRSRPETGPSLSVPALGRIVTLTDAMTDRTPPRLLELAPADAAAAIVDQLRAWGYLEPTEELTGT